MAGQGGTMAKKTTAPTSGVVTRRSTGGGATPPASTAPNGRGRRDPTHDQIAEAAYQRYLSRGGGHGSDFDDWLEAERELRERKAR